MREVLLISRPRFWIYLLGPFLVGSTSAVVFSNGQPSFPVIMLAVYFTLPANLLIYGANDIFDFETDILNDKKGSYEPLVQKHEHRHLLQAILITNLPFLPLLAFLNPATLGAIGLFLFLGIFYSAPPIRAKARPFLDSAFNALYVMPGIAGYFALGGTNLSLPLVAAAVLWSAAMHAYSAVPDIEADTQAKLRTIATTLGARGTILFCTLAYVAAGLITGSLVGLIGWLGLGVYVLLMLISLHALKHGYLMQVYKQFPIINTVMGALLFLSIVLELF